ncbi:MAG: DEAD/DEAH box helicase, partial [Coriobacteriales bacterium]|nr:DEAD/DEAH box helicase [Coriobacteriales bacterium]
AFDVLDLYSRRASAIGLSYPKDDSYQKDMEKIFPYKETPDQLQAIEDVKNDMLSRRPMDRLICGDVGFGKTEVALRAAFKAVINGRQVMFLCPTTILAQQHFNTFFERFCDFGIFVDVLSRFKTKSEQRKILQDFSDGNIDILVGTHRLLSSDVCPCRLGLVIIDEEQRFGVAHKEHLKNLREYVDVLTLSATPIPRTLQMALSGVRDMSVITTPPKNRKPIKVHVGEYDENIICQAIKVEMMRNGQVYYISNRIKGIEDVKNELQKLLPDVRIAVAHGSLSSKQLEDIMEHFVAKEYDVLLSTTIVESGIDNPYTNTLIIDNAQNLGLAQMYQLKGRVGRSNKQAYAYFFYPKNAALSKQAYERLSAIDEFDDIASGLKIAMRDLEIRGAGTLLGAKQSGNVASIGFDLFADILSNAINTSKNKDQSYNMDFDVALDLKGQFFIPPDYVQNIEKMILYYRKIAFAKTLKDVSVIKTELKRKYGDLPESVKNLLIRAKIKIFCTILKINQISQSTTSVSIFGVEENFYLQLLASCKSYKKYKELKFNYKKTQKNLLIKNFDSCVDVEDFSAYLSRLFDILKMTAK